MGCKHLFTWDRQNEHHSEELSYKFQWTAKALHWTSKKIQNPWGLRTHGKGIHTCLQTFFHKLLWVLIEDRAGCCPHGASTGKTRSPSWVLLPASLLWDKSLKLQWKWKSKKTFHSWGRDRNMCLAQGGWGGTLRRPHAWCQEHSTWLWPRLNQNFRGLPLHIRLRDRE